MRASARKLAFAAIPLFCLAGSAWCQTSSLEGDVKGEDGQPLRNAIVRIERKDIKGNYKTKTDKKGHYFHAGLPLGVYKVILEVDGKDRDMVDNVRTRLGDPVVNNFDLQRIKMKQQAMAKAAETGQLSQELSREMTSEQRAAMERTMKERQAQLSKQKGLNDAFNAGKDAASQKNWDAAIQAYTKAAEMDPQQHVVWASLAETYINAAATKSGPDKDTALAKGFEAWNKALELKPDDSGYRNNYALALGRAGKIQEAQAELVKAAQLDPSQAGRHYYNLGATLINTMKRENEEPACEAFAKAVELDPNYAPAQYQHGNCLMKFKMTMTPDGKPVIAPGTKEAFEKYLQMEPNGQFAQLAKEALQALSLTIQTEYTNPNAPVQKKKKK